MYYAIWNLALFWVLYIFVIKIFFLPLISIFCGKIKKKIVNFFYYLKNSINIRNLSIFDDLFFFLLYILHIVWVEGVKERELEYINYTQNKHRVCDFTNACTKGNKKRERVTANKIYCWCALSLAMSMCARVTSMRI